MIGAGGLLVTAMSSVPRDELTISLAAYNDASTIGPLVDEVIAVASDMKVSFRVLIINDGSADQTQVVLEELARRDSRVEVLHHDRNLGFGPTLREAYLTPTSQWVVYLPGDAQVPAEALRILWDQRHHADIVVGRRWNRRDDVRRRTVSWMYNQLVSWCAGVRLRDVNGTALVHQRVLEKIELAGRSAFIHAELVLEALRVKARLVECAIPHRERAVGRGSGNRLDVMAGAMVDLSRYALSSYRGLPK